VGGGEELPQETAPITAETPEKAEYYSGPLTPFERTHFLVVEPQAAIEKDRDVPPPAPPEIPYRLEKGAYYVQIGGYSNAERIEAIVRELGATYPLVVMGQRYILIGPLNEGESNALEQRFRVRGYPNAFVVVGK
jgi:hypothetical protein